MSQSFTTFSYINTDTLALISSLWHNVSDSEARPTYMVAGFVPVYDHRLDSQGQAPCTQKFGLYDQSSSTYTTYPEANVYESPFNTLGSVAGGILFNEDIYLWRPLLQAGYTSRVYNFVKNSATGIGGAPRETDYTIASAYAELVDAGTSGLPVGTLRYFNNIPDTNGTGSINNKAGELGTYWNVRTTIIDPAVEKQNRELLNVSLNGYFGVNTINNKICVPNSGMHVYNLSIGESGLTNNLTSYSESSPEWDIAGGTNRNTKMSTITAAGITSTSWTLLDPDYTISTGDAVQDLLPSGLNPKIEKVIDVSTLRGSNFDLYLGAKNFSKGYTSEDGVEQTISSYRIQFSDQVGTVRFNKIVTYVQLYTKDLATNTWGWSEKYYPFTVTVLPEPITKSDYGKPGVDSFELDIQIDYNQMVQTAKSGGQTTIIFDTEISNNYDGWSVLKNPLQVEIRDPYAITADPTISGLFGTQFDSRLFVSKDVDISEYNSAGTRTGDLFREKYGRINSDNKTYVYYDLNYSAIEFQFNHPVGAAVTTKTCDYLIAYKDLSNPNKIYHTAGVYNTTDLLSVNPLKMAAIIYEVGDANFSLALENKNEALSWYSIQIKSGADPMYEMLPDGSQGAAVIKDTFLATYLTTISDIDIKNQLSICNTVDFSNNGQFLELNSNGIYSTYFKWHFDMTGSQNALSEFEDVSTDIVHPKIDIDVKWFGDDLMKDVSALPTRLFTKESDTFNENWWQLDTFRSGEGNAQRDYSPSMQPYRADENSNTLVKMGLGRMSNPWEHIIGNRIYGKQTYGDQLNGRQISLVRFDGKPKSYNNFNEDYMFNKVIYGNDSYESIGTLPFSTLTGSPIFISSYGANDNPDTEVDENKWGMIVDKTFKDGQKVHLFQVQGVDLTVNSVTTNPYSGNTSRLVSGLVDTAFYNRFFGYDVNKRLIDLTVDAGSNINVKNNQHSQRLYKTMYSGDLGLRGQYFGGEDYQASITGIALNTSMASYNNSTPITSITSIVHDVPFDTLLKQQRNMSLIGSGMVLNYDNDFVDFNYTGILRNTTQVLNYIPVSNDASDLATVNTVSNLPAGLSVGSHGLDLLTYNGVGGVLPSAKSLVKVLLTNSTTNVADANSNISAIFTVETPSNLVMFDILTKEYNESDFIGRQDWTDTAENISNGLVVTNQLLSLIFKYPGNYSKNGLMNTNRLGSYYQYNELNSGISYDEQWKLFSHYIFNYGKLYQDDGIVVNNVYKDGTQSINFVSSYVYETAGNSNNGDLPSTIDVDKMYTYFNMSRLSDSTLAFDLNITRDETNDSIMKNNWNTAKGVPQTQYPASFGFEKSGEFFIKMFDQDDSSRASGTTLDSTNFDYTFTMSSKMTTISSNIIPRTPFIGLYDPVALSVAVDELPYLTDSSFAAAAPIDPSTLPIQATSTINIGGKRTTAKFNEIRSNVNYTNVIAYDLMKDYTDFLTGKVTVAKSIGTNSGILNANYFFSHYVGLSAAPEVSISDPANYYPEWTTNIWNESYNTVINKNPDATIIDVTDDISKYYKSVDVLDQKTDNNLNSNVATLFMNTGLYSNLLPSTDDKWSITILDYSKKNNPLYSYGLGRATRNSYIIKTKTYGISTFKLGMPHASFKNISTNELTTSLVFDKNYKYDPLAINGYSKRLSNEHPFPYVDWSENINYDKFAMPITKIRKQAGSNVEEDPILVAVNVMNNLDVTTGDLIPSRNTVIRYFNSNYEKYLNGTNKRRDADDSYKSFQTGYVTDSTPALGSETSRFSDGYFNRLSIKFVGRLDERNLFQGQYYNRQENTRGIDLEGAEVGKGKSDIRSNRIDQMLFAKDVHDSGYLEFINQPERDIPEFRSRFLMEPAGGYDYLTHYSGATNKQYISHALFWKHDIYDPQQQSISGYLGKETPFKILPQMVFQYTTPTDSVGWSTNLVSYPINSNATTITPVPTIDLGGWYSGDRNPVPDTAAGQQPGGKRYDYNGMYLYEFNKMYGRELISSGLVSTPRLNAQFLGTNIEVGNSLIPVSDYVSQRNLGNKDNTWNEIWNRTQTITFDTKDFVNSQLLLDASQYKHLTFANITQATTTTGAVANVESKFQMSSAGSSIYNYECWDVGYNLDEYHQTAANSTNPWPGFQFNNFHVKWDWNYDAGANKPAAPWDLKIRFSILPKMVEGITRQTGYYKEILQYRYPTMNLGGWDNDLENPYYFHSTHQWHVKTGTIGILGTRVYSNDNVTDCGTDARAVTFLDSTAYSGGVFNDCATTVPSIIGQKSVYIPNSYWNSANFSNPILTEATYDLSIMNDSSLKLGIDNLENDTSEVLGIWESAKTIFDSVYLDMNNRNRAYGKTQVTDADGDLVWGTDPSLGRQRLRGSYGVNFIQGEHVKYKIKNALSQSIENYLPIYVSGDLLPGVRLNAKGTKVVSEQNQYGETVYYIQNDPAGQVLNSSLGAPGYEWESIWCKQSFISNIISPLINTDKLVIGQELQPDNYIPSSEWKNVIITPGIISITTKESNKDKGLIQFGRYNEINDWVTQGQRKVLTIESLSTAGVGLNIASQNVLQLKSEADIFILGTDDVTIGTTEGSVTIERPLGNGMAGGKFNFVTDGIDIDTVGRIMTTSNFVCENSWSSTDYFYGNPSDNDVWIQHTKNGGPSLGMIADATTSPEVLKLKYNRLDFEIKDDLYEWKFDMFTKDGGGGGSITSRLMMKNNAIVNTYRWTAPMSGGANSVALSDGSLRLYDKAISTGAELEDFLLNITDQGLFSTKGFGTVDLSTTSDAFWAINKSISDLRNTDKYKSIVSKEYVDLNKKYKIITISGNAPYTTLLNPQNGSYYTTSGILNNKTPAVGGGIISGVFQGLLTLQINDDFWTINDTVIVTIPFAGNGMLKIISTTPNTGNDTIDFINYIDTGDVINQGGEIILATFSEQDPIVTKSFRIIKVCPHGYLVTQIGG